MQLAELGILLLQLGEGELLDSELLRDLRLERIALADELAILVVAVGAEPVEHLGLLRRVERDGLEQHRFAAHLGGIVLEHLEATNMIVGSRQQADAALQVHGTHSLEAPPHADAPGRRFSGNFVCE